MTTISATPILSSAHHETGDRVTTLVLRYPRFIHAEFMTHRLFSRNAGSSRAIPVRKLIRDVISDPVVPIYWGSNKPGMQAGEEIGTVAQLVARTLWLSGMWAAVGLVWTLHLLGLHKQICNRLLEPWAHITVVVTATNWSNFLHLRDHPDAEPHIRALARSIRACLDGMPVQTLKPGEWHLPFATGNHHENLPFGVRRIVCVACCASASYKTVDGFDMTVERASAIWDKLRYNDTIHASPFEHACMADRGAQETYDHGNFVGFVPFRKMLPGECR